MILPVQVTFRNTPHSDRVEELIREQAADLDRYYNHIMGCRVVVEVPHHHQVEGDHYSIRIRLTVPGGEVVANREPTLHSRQQDAKEEQHTKEREIEATHKYVAVAINEAFDTARRRLQDFARRQRLDVKTRHGRVQGRVSSIEPDEDFGHIEAGLGYEVYFHRNSVLGGDFDHLAAGSEVSFVEEEGEKGPQASSVKPIGSHRRHKARKGAAG
jgi:cold shock CspA family protein